MISITDMNATSKRLTSLYEEWMQPICKTLGMPFTALVVLMYFANNPNKNTAHELCEYRGYKRAIVSLHIESLVQKGYLERRAVEGDRRKFGIICTKKAEAVIKECRAYQKGFTESLTDGLSKEDLEKIEECFDILRRNIEHMSKTNV